MDEEIKEAPQEPEKAEPTPPEDAGVQSETENQFVKASGIVKDLNTALDRKEKLVEREEKLEVQRQLAGKGQTGIAQKPVDKEAEAANERVMAVGRATGARWAQDDKTSEEVLNKV